MPSRLAWATVWLVLMIPLVLGGVVALADDPADEEPTIGDSASRADRINTSAIEAAMHHALNDRRAAAGLSALPERERVSAQATNWSRRIAGEAAYEHSPRGHYACPAGTAENLATLPAYGRVELDTGEIVRYDGNETALGKALVGVWNRSPPHRNNMLDPTHTAHAPGIAVGERNGTVTVYATSAFCSE